MENTLKRFLCLTSGKHVLVRCVLSGCRKNLLWAWAKHISKVRLFVCFFATEEWFLLLLDLFGGMVPSPMLSYLGYVSFPVLPLPFWWPGLLILTSYPVIWDLCFYHGLHTQISIETDESMGICTICLAVPLSWGNVECRGADTSATLTKLQTFSL